MTSRPLALALLALLLSAAGPQVPATPSEAPEPPSTARTLRGAPHSRDSRTLPRGGAPQPTGEASSFVQAAPRLRHGTLSYVSPRFGPDYLALPEPRGTVATICGPADCVTRRSTDYGPDQRVHPERIADLSAADFVRVCGVPLSAGLCRGTVEIEPPVDPADDAARAEDGGPTLPPTSTEDR